jgi:hypothetical protein
MTMKLITRSYHRVYLLLCSILLASMTPAYAGWLDSGKKLAAEAAEPIGIVIMMIGGMKISQKDLYAGIAAVVGGIFIFKAPDIVAGLR